jgi:hypothetical protein
VNYRELKIIFMSIKALYRNDKKLYEFVMNLQYF